MASGGFGKVWVHRDGVVRFTRRWRAFARCRNGAIAIITALTLPVAVGFLGLGVEVGLWYYAKRDLQTAADAAAISAAYEVARNYDAATMNASAASSAAVNGYDGTKNDTLAVHNPPLSGPFAGNNRAVQAIMTRDMSLLFSGLFLPGPVTITVNAVALNQSVTDFCILGLHPTQSGAVSVGGTATVNLACGMATNSNSNSAMTIFGNANVAAAGASAVGGISVSGNGTLNASQSTNIAAITDPYASLPPPGSETTNPKQACDHSGTIQVNNNQSQTFNPGIYCGDIRVNSGGTAHFNPGTYVLRGGELRVNGGTVTGAGVFFYFTNSGSTWGKVNISGGSVTLSAPTSGTYQGVLFFQDRSAPLDTSNSNRNVINGNANTQLTGALYFPSRKIEYVGGSAAGPSCTVIVGAAVEFTGSSTMQISGCEAAGVDVPAATVVRLAG